MLQLQFETSIWNLIFEFQFPISFCNFKSKFQVELEFEVRQAFWFPIESSSETLKSKILVEIWIRIHMSK